MSFMKPHVEHGDYFEVETTYGSEVVPCDVVGRTMSVHVEALLNYLEGEPLDPEELCTVRTGWLARMHAPGYMDCIPWAAYSSERRAREALDAMYGDDDRACE